MANRMDEVESYLDETVAVDPNKTSNIVADRTVFSMAPYARLALNGSTDISIALYVDEQYWSNASDVKLFYWTSEQYASADKLAIIEDQYFQMENADTALEHGRNLRAVYTGWGTAAKDLGESIYFCAAVEIDGQMVYSPVFVYSVETYAGAKLYATDSLGDQGALMKRLTVYGECAKLYFDSL